MSNSKFDIDDELSEQLKKGLEEEITKLFVNHSRGEETYLLMLRIFEKIRNYEDSLFVSIYRGDLVSIREEEDT
jgi:hypothetical protein